MPLTVEDGFGLPEADSFVALAEADAYWAARPHAALSTRWAEAAVEAREGALREAAAHLGARYGARFTGAPTRGRDQALCWPRSDARDRSGAPLASDVVPREIMAAACELAARALAGPLSQDRASGGRVTEELVTVDALTTRTSYAVDAPAGPAHPVVEALVAPLLRAGGPNLRRG